MAGSAVLFTVRRLLITALSAVAAIFVARLLGPSTYGPFVSAQAMYGFGLALVDLGFGLYIAREMSKRPADRPKLLASGLQVQSVWATVVALAVGALGLLIDGMRGDVLLVLAPGVLISGLNSYRQIFFVLYRVRSLMVIDISVNIVQIVAMVTVAALGASVIVVAATYTAGTVINTLLVARAGRRLIAPRGADSGTRRELLRASGGLGISSLMASLYFSLDLVVLGWLVDDAALGEYGAAVKVLSLLVMMPGMIMSTALPGLASVDGDSGHLGELAARVWHWLMVAGLPAAVGIAIFADPLIDITFGPDYSGAVASLRVLCLAAAVALLSNLTGMLMVSKHLIRPQITQNGVAIVANVVGNIIFAPVYGIVAAAWLTVMAELIVFMGGLWALRTFVDFKPAVRVSLRPFVVVAVAGGIGIALLHFSTSLAIFAYVLSLLLGAFGLDAWPDELRIPFLARRRVAGQQL